MKLRLFLGTIALLLSTSSVTYSDTLTLVADDWCPYNCSEKGTPPGFLVEFAREIFSAAGHTVEYKVVPWARAVEEVKAGRYTALLGAVPEEAPELVYPGRPAWHSVDGFYVKKGNPWRYTGKESLLKVTLGAIIDYGYGGGIQEYVEEHGSDPKRVQLSSGEEPLHVNVRKLLAGRVDVVVEDTAVMDHYASNQQLGEKIELAGTSEPQPVYISFSPKESKAKEYSALLSKGLEELEKSGAGAKILKRYGIETRKPPSS